MVALATWIESEQSAPAAKNRVGDFFGPDAHRVGESAPQVVEGDWEKSGRRYDSRRGYVLAPKVNEDLKKCYEAASASHQSAVTRFDSLIAGSVEIALDQVRAELEIAGWDATLVFLESVNDGLQGAVIGSATGGYGAAIRYGRYVKRGKQALASAKTGASVIRAARQVAQLERLSRNLRFGAGFAGSTAFGLNGLMQSPTPASDTLASIADATVVDHGLAGIGWNALKATATLMQRANALEQTGHDRLSNIGAFAKERAAGLQQEYTNAIAECDRKYGN